MKLLAMREHPVGRWVLAFLLAATLYTVALSWEIARTPELRTGVASLISSWTKAEIQERVDCLVLDLKTQGKAKHCGRDR